MNYISISLPLKILILLAAVVGYCHAQKTFRNPILDETAPGPSIIKHDGLYYMVFAKRGDRLELLRSPVLSDFRNAERQEIYQIPENWTGNLIPKIHSIQGDLYIYFSMDDEVGSRRMFVIKCLDPSNPFGEWSSETRLLPEEEFYALQGVVLQYPNGNLYLIWSGYPDPAPPEPTHNLYIARMENPMKAVAPRTLLRAPTKDWERHEAAFSEAPAILQNHGRTLLVFSASYYASPDYCLGIIGIDGGQDPMLPSNWWDDVDECVFGKNDAEGVLGSGHAFFVRSQDETELWMAYDAWDWANQTRWVTSRIQKIGWEMNTPVFPEAMGTDRDLEVPSGE